MSIANGKRYSFSGSRHENSWRTLPLFLAIACLGLGVGCGTRAVATPTTIDGSSGGFTGTGGSAGTGGVGSGGRTGGGGGAIGTGGNISTDGGLNCNAVGCAAPPLCSEGCHEACGCCPCTSGERNGNLVCVGGCYAPIPADASVDGPADVTVDGSSDGPGDGPGDAPGDAAAICEGIKSEYAAALRTAQECGVAGSHQCEIQVRAGFFCNCTTFANSGAETLAAIVTRFQTTGCFNLCAGICVQQQVLTCLPDATSSTGGRCRPPGVLALAAADNGGTFSVSVGDEVDIVLESVAPGSYSMDVQRSSDVATVLEITIPAGAPNPNGPTRLYRLRALSAGEVRIQIPFEPASSDSKGPTYVVTIAPR